MTNPVPSTTSNALHLLKADPFLGDKKSKKTPKHYHGVCYAFFCRKS